MRLLGFRSSTSQRQGAWSISAPPTWRRNPLRRVAGLSSTLSSSSLLSSTVSLGRKLDKIEGGLFLRRERERKGEGKYIRGWKIWLLCVWLGTFSYPGKQYHVHFLFFVTHFEWDDFSFIMQMKGHWFGQNPFFNNFVGGYEKGFNCIWDDY